MRQLLFGVCQALFTYTKKIAKSWAVIFACLFIIQATTVSGQSSKVDSLQKLLRENLSDSSRFEILLQLAKQLDDRIKKNKYYHEVYGYALSLQDESQKYKGIEAYAQWLREDGANPDTIIAVYNQGLEILKNPKPKISTYYALGEFYFGQGEDALAEVHIIKGIELAQKGELSWNVARGYIVLGNGQFYKLEYEKAFTYYTKADSVCAKSDALKVSALRAKILNYIGYAVRITHGYEKAVEYYLQARDMYQEIGDQAGLQEVNLGLIQYYTNIDEYSKAERLLTDAINYYRERGPQSSYTYAIISRGYFFLKQDKFENAERDYRLYYDLAFQGTNKMFQLNALNYMSYLYLEMDRLELASQLGERGIKLSEELGERATRKIIFEQLIDIYTEMGAVEKLNQTYEDYLDLRNELDSIGKDKEIFELETKYQTEKKEQEIALLTAQNELAEQEKQNQFYLLLGIVLIVCIAAIFLYILYRNRQNTARKLQEIDSLKSNFFANISHEFRTPLTLIKAPIQKQLSQNIPSEQRESLEMVNRNTDRLLALVDQLLDISKLESGALSLKVQQGNLSRFSSLLIAPFQYLAKQKDIKFSQDVAKTKDCYFDKDVLEKILINLLSNACKYTPKGGEIRYEQVMNNGWATIKVKNTGDGIPEDQQDKIFDRFYQMSEAREGVGIGLALVKELATLHKGSIKLTTDSNGFTCFEVNIPVSKDSYASTEIIESTEEDTNKVSVINGVQQVSDNSEELESIESEKPIMLIVDDSVDLRKLIKDLFIGSYSILLAENGEEGIIKAIENVPDIIISDVMMPVKDGVALSQTLKADERTSHIPIILLTAKAGEENELKGLETGADEYMVKPFNNDILKVRIEKLIELRAQLRSRYSQELILKPKEIAITSADEKFLNRVEELLDEKLTASDFTADTFSKEIGMSRMQLHRKLKALVGLSTTEFIRSQRLKLAAKLLQKPGINIAEVAYACGFNDPSYFSKCFKEAYGNSPSVYADEHSMR